MFLVRDTCWPLGNDQHLVKRNHPRTSYFIPKVIAVAAVLIATLCIAALTAILVQLFRGYTAIELDK